MNGLPDFSVEFSTIADFLTWWLRNPVLPPPHDAVFANYYNRYRKRFGPYLRHQYAEQTRETATIIAESTLPRLLEVGGGCGTEALWFALKGARVLAIDINEERLGVARARQAIVERGIGRKLDLEFRFCSLFDLLDSDFDVIWMEQAFHHIEPRERTYATIARLLAKDGRVVISEANGWNLLLQLALFRKRGFKTIVDRQLPNGERVLYGNERITVPFALARGFAAVGIERESVRYFRTLPNIAAADVFLSIEGAVPQAAAPMFSHYNYVGRKAARMAV